MSLVHYKVFGKDTKPTIYYFTGYKTTIRLFSPHAWLLKLLGFRIMAFEYQPKVLDGGEPQLLIDALHEILELVKKDAKSREVTGVYGISLGTFFAYNILKFPGIDRVAFNAGGASLLRAVWDVQKPGRGKLNFIAHGYSREDLDKLWSPYDIVAAENDLKNRQLLVIASEADQAIAYQYVKDNLDIWQKHPENVTLYVNHRLGHGSEIVRNLLRLRITAKFFRQ